MKCYLSNKIGIKIKILKFKSNNIKTKILMHAYEYPLVQNVFFHQIL